MAFAHAQQTLGHQTAVVGVQSHHIGDRAQGHQGQQAIKLGFGLFAEDAALTQLGSQGQQHVKHHAHTRHAFALEAATGLVGVDQGVRCG